MGGHYYAYIKPWESGKWYNFNDSTVSLIDDKKLKKDKKPEVRPTAEASATPRGPARVSSLPMTEDLAERIDVIAPHPLARLRFDGLEIDLERRQVLRLGTEVELTGTEFELLLMLAQEPQKVFSRDEILNRLHGNEADLFTRAVDILVSRLRRKLEPLDCIKTLRNAGYAFAGARA